MVLLETGEKGSARHWKGVGKEAAAQSSVLSCLVKGVRCQGEGWRRGRELGWGAVFGVQVLGFVYCTSHCGYPRRVWQVPGWQGLCMYFQHEPRMLRGQHQRGLMLPSCSCFLFKHSN